MLQQGQIDEKFSRFDEQWRPKVIASLNGQEVKIVKALGSFPWHVHDDCNEMFLVWREHFQVEFRDRIVNLGPGDFVVVPRGAEHRTAAEEEAEVLIFEPSNVLNTGSVLDQTFTAPKGVRI